MNVSPPKITWKPLKGYNLANMEADFAIADFERRPNSSHIKNIVNSVLGGEFYDTTLRVVPGRKAKWIIIDAQHRIQAFKILRDLHGLKSYDFMLAVYDAGYARKIYRKLNMGKNLRANDHTVAIDDGTIPFFNELRDYCYHYRTPDRMAFLDVLYAYNFARKIRYQSGSNKIDIILESVRVTDIPVLRNFLHTLKSHFPIISGEMLYRMAVFRASLRIGLEKRLTVEQFLEMFEIISKNKLLEDLSLGRREYNVTSVYNIIRDEIVEKLKK